MRNIPINWRILSVMAHDALATVAALLLSFFLRFDMAGLVARTEALKWIVPFFVIYATGVYSVLHLYRAKWRFASLPDLVNIFRASTVLALTLLAFDYVFASSAFMGTLVFGKITLFLYWVLQMFALGGPRILYRYIRYIRARNRPTGDIAAALLVGSATEADVLLRAIESGAVKNIVVLGLLSPIKHDKGQVIRTARILGRPQDMESVLVDLEQNQLRPRRIILLPSALFDTGISQMLGVARRFAIPVNRLSSLAGEEQQDGSTLKLENIDVEDLLFRDSVGIDHARLHALVAGKKVAVTGGAGSIGGEICRRIIELGASELLVLDHAEAALFEIVQRLKERKSATSIVAHLADVRHASRIENLLQKFKPDLVFHAAALKHVPIVEKDWAEGLATNIFGTVNVCRAALAAGARGIVVISTDKAVEPVSVLGLSKRFGELYAAALDQGKDTHSRFISVRFGNVLGSSGSVVPIFKSQIAAGGPLTVTHQAMVRYFMTAREACDLVLTAASHAQADNTRASSVYVLDMGQPVRILDLAERMIRLSGLEPERDIEIEFSGIRDGERLQEALFSRDETLHDIGFEGVSAALRSAPALADLEEILSALKEKIELQDRTGALALLQALLAGKSAKPRLAVVKAG